jgi:hypothetical protein
MKTQSANSIATALRTVAAEGGVTKATLGSDATPRTISFDPSKLFQAAQTITQLVALVRQLLALAGRNVEPAEVDKVTERAAAFGIKIK